MGTIVAGQTFYIFTIENLKQFGALKAMGVTNSRLIGMILLQALVVGGAGYGLGVGMTAIFFEATSPITHLAGLYMTPVAFGAVGVAVFFIIMLTALISIRRVLVLEPAVVFLDLNIPGDVVHNIPEAECLGVLAGAAPAGQLNVHITVDQLGLGQCEHERQFGLHGVSFLRSSLVRSSLGTKGSPDLRVRFRAA